MSRGTSTPINWRRPGYNYGGYGDDPSGQLVFQRPLSLHAAPVNVSRRTNTTTWNPWQGERVATRPSNLSRFSEERVLVPEYGMIRDEVNPTPRASAREDHSRSISVNEQNKALNKLRKEIYNPVPKNITRRVSLYYRSNGRNNNNNLEKVDDKEQGKNCVICLEDFVAREVVMVTPCNHMFHEECIVPWVKTRGQCPVCRFTMGEKQQPSGPNQTGSTVVGAAPPVPVPALEIVNLSPNDLFATELISIVRAMEEAFLGSNFR